MNLNQKNIEAQLELVKANAALRVAFDRLIWHWQQAIFDPEQSRPLPDMVSLMKTLVRVQSRHFDAKND